MKTKIKPVKYLVRDSARGLASNLVYDSVRSLGWRPVDKVSDSVNNSIWELIWSGRENFLTSTE